ncbi:MAG: DUF3343 domain-containing protein [Tissierellia bacterium]|nr:DUF3343 domain-containing protein [Tissierellia bacterium]
MEHLIITFHQLTDALAFEEAGKPLDESLRLIPVPRAISSSCGLAGKTVLLLEDVQKLVEEKALSVEGIYQPNGPLYEKLWGE